MTSQDTGGVRLPDGRAAASACRSRLTRSLCWLLASSGRTARGWGATGGGWGALWVGGAFVQYAQPLASRSRPSWSRPTRGRGRRRTMTTGTLRRRRAGSSGGEPATGAPGRAARTPGSLLRGPVSTALTSTSLPPKHPAEIVEILRLLPGVRRRYTFNVSTMDTSDLPGPARPLLFGASSPTGQSTCPRRSGLEPESASSTPTRRSSHRAGVEGGNSSNERGLRPANRSEPPSQSSPGKDLS